MSDVVIRVEDLSKQYRLGTVGTGTLRHDLNRLWHRLRGKEDPYLKIGEVNDRTKKSGSEYVWALKDINFEVKQGEVLGIIGRNGAGKSTLLKILSKITAPTTGRVKVKGRIASLLEVGTGFHPELTGRENIFLNGAILGMRKDEIRAKFDEIVDFSGVEAYIDTPVKRYSSGMYVRLAFAVAAHLDPEILVVDEVLAVGDSEFQNKAIGRMNKVSRSLGKTVLFVSHNLGMISSLCTSGILLNNGIIGKAGPINEIIEFYISQKRSKHTAFSKEVIDSEIHFTKILMTDFNGQLRSEYAFDEKIYMNVGINVPFLADKTELAMRLIDRNERGIFTIHEPLANYIGTDKIVDLVIEIPSLFITPGEYSWVVCLNQPGKQAYDLLTEISGFRVLETGSIFSRYQGGDYGSIYARYEIKKKNHD